jgi:hypothetical protein
LAVLSLAGHAIACDSGQPKPAAGGSTEDFNGHDGAPLCTKVSDATSSRVSLDEVSSMGFSPRQMLDLIEGSYTLPIRWVHPCSDYECGGTACAEADSGAPEWTRSFVETPFTDTQTILRVRVEATGEAATVRSHAEGTTECDDTMTIPALLSASSDDGALDEQLSVQLESNRANVAWVSFERRAAELHGAFSTDLAAGATVELSLAIERVSNEVSLGLRVTVGGAGGYSTDPLLQGALLDTGCSNTVSRDDALEP